MNEAEIRDRLLGEQTRLQAVKDGLVEEHALDEASGAAAGELSSYDQHPGDVGTETFEREKAMAIVERLEGELEDVKRALRRLDEGTYGTCEACGRPIPAERLEASPGARYCLEDQARLEKEARGA